MTETEASQRHIISTTADGAQSAFAADIDGDDDLDVIVGSGTDGMIAWYENRGSAGFTHHTISTSANGVMSVLAVDIDGDGDRDVLSGAQTKEPIVWHENDGNGNFTAHTIITTSTLDMWRVSAADVDGDGDMDVLSTSSQGDTIAWHENDGNQGFTVRVISTSADAASSVFATDLDDDGDLDVLATSYFDDTIAWYENDGSEKFTAHTITTSADGARAVSSADVDGDGDQDILSAAYIGDTIAWHENDGSMNFATHVITTSAQLATSVFAADMDGDGDLDVLSSSSADGKIAWYENLANTAPVLAPIGDKTVNEQATLSFDATASDQDIPADTLTFSLDQASLDAGMTITADGAFAWTPTELQGGSDYHATITVTDDGTPALSDFQTFTITVAEVNVEPVLGLIDNRSVDEQVELAFTATATDQDRPANTLTFSLDQASLDAGMTITADGAFAWMPTELQGGSDYQATITVTDDGTPALSDFQTFTIMVAEVNVAPVLGLIDNRSVDEQVELTFTATATDQDRPANTLTFSLDQASLDAGMTITADGAFAWTPTEQQGGSDYQATITVTDDGTPAFSDFQTFTITVAEINVAPVLGLIDNRSVDEQVELAFTATATDQDRPANTLTFSLDQASLDAGMTITADGAFAWTPTELQGGSDYQATITVTDDGTPALSDFQTFTITVAEINVAPVLGLIDNRSVDEQVELAFTATATDQDRPANTLTFSLDQASLDAGMTITADGAFAWTPTELQGGSDYQATITVTDDGTPALTDFQTFTITVAEVNVAPVLGLIDNQSVDEQVELTFTATATDQDRPANTLTFSLDQASLDAGMTITAEGAFAWMPTELQGGSDYQATITVTDDGTPALTDFQTFTITVAEVNVAPDLGLIDNRSVDERVELAFTATATDQDRPANTLTFSLDQASLDAGMTITAEGAFAWMPTELQGGSDYQATITVTDDGTPAFSDFQTFTITVAEINVAPVLGLIDNRSVDEQVELAFTATATDQDRPANTLTFSLDQASLDAGMTITADGAFAWTPTELQGGSDYQATITVTDDGTPALSDFQTFTITVAEINVAPVLGLIDNRSVDEQVELAFTATATDQDRPANTLTFSLDQASLDAGMTITADGAFAWTPTELQGGSDYQATITVTDDGTPALTDFQTFTITVAEVNVAPVLGLIDNQSVDEQVELTFTATATDQDRPANTLTFSLDQASLDAGMTITAEGAFAWMPTELQGGSDYQATITVTDDGKPALTDFQTFTITVAEVNVAPDLGLIDNRSVDERVELAFTATATDQDRPANTLTFSLDQASLDAGMTITAEGAFAWMPTELQGGSDYQATITVTDDGTPALSDFQTFTITVAEVNAAPVLGLIDNRSVDEQVELAFTATATDQDRPANTLTFSLDQASLDAGMTITADGAFAWMPTELQGGSDYDVTITVTDDGTPALTDFQTFTITVAEVNVAPVLGLIDNRSVDEQVELAFTATATDQDRPANTLTFSLDQASLDAGMTITADGAFAWTPTELQGGSDYQATITVTDDGTPALTDFQTFTITVAEVNVAPVLGLIDNRSVDEQVELAFTATATDQDRPANTLTFSLDQASLDAGMTITADGAFAWTPTELQGGSDYQATITVTDDGTPALSDFQTFTITVNEVNVEPDLGLIDNRSVDEQVELAFTATATDQDRPANTLTFSLDQASLDAGMTITADGAFAWMPTELQGGSDYQATITVTDDGTPALSDFQTFTITVAEINVAPFLSLIDNRSVDEQVELAFTATATDQDRPANTLTFSLDQASLDAGMTITADGAFAWTPTELQDGSDYDVTITVTDDGTPALTDFQTFTITVTEVNVAPFLGLIDNRSVDEQVELAFTATATDQDRPANTLTFSLDQASLDAGMTITADGAFAWTPTELQGGSDYQATITVTDDGTPALSDFQTFTITVAEVNVAPDLGLIDNRSVDERVELAFTATATDQDRPANTLTFSLDQASLDAGMTITADGAFAWMPTELQGGSDYQATITVTDDGTPALSDFQTFTITVAEVNAAPVLGLIDNRSVDEQVELAFTATATDQDRPANTLTFSLDQASLDAGMTITADGAFAWMPTELQGGSDYQATITVTDDGTPALSDFQTFTITVAEINVAPFLSLIDNRSVDEQVELAFTATATDQDRPANTLTFSLDQASLDAGMTITADGAFAWTPTELQGGSDYDVTITVTDDGTPALTDFQTFTITVTEVNVAPFLGLIDNQSVDEQVELAFTATATDQDRPANTLTFSLDQASLDAGMTITADGAFAWMPTEQQGGSDYQATITVTDDGTPALSDFQTFTITVAEVNVAPVLGLIDNQSVDEQVELAFTATATDQDRPANTLTFSLDQASLDAGMTITADGAFAWTPTELQGGSDYDVTITVTDDGTPALTDFQTFTITVTEVNVAPFLGLIDNQSVDEQVELTFTATATDQDRPANTLTFSLADAPVGALIDPVTGEFSWTPTELQIGEHTFTVVVSDGQLTDTEEVAVTVNQLIVQPIDLGTVGFTPLSGLNVNNGELWYQFTAPRQGVLSVIVSAASGSVTATLYNNPRTVPALAVSDSVDGRLDHSVQDGDTYLLKISGDSADAELTIANLVTVDGDGVHVFGTDDADDFEFALTDSYLVTINGVEYHFEDTADVAEKFSFDGGQGIDSATFRDSEADESARFFTGTGEFYSGSEFYDETGFFVDATAEHLIAHSVGGRDFIKMYDSPGDDLFTATPEMATLVGPGYSHTAHSFYIGLGYAMNREGDDGTGGYDRAILDGSADYDKFKLDWASPKKFFGKIYGSGYYRRGKNFESIDANGFSGDDFAVAIGSPNADEFFLQKDVGRVTNARTEVNFLGFDRVIAHAQGGYDIVRFEDAAGTDELRCRSLKAEMKGSGYNLIARRFEEVFAESKHGGGDKAKLHDTVLNDHAVVSGNTASLYTNDPELDLLYEVVAFEWVKLYGTDDGSRDTLEKNEPLDFLFFYVEELWEELP